MRNALIGKNIRRNEDNSIQQEYDPHQFMAVKHKFTDRSISQRSRKNDTLKNLSNYVQLKFGIKQLPRNQNCNQQWF